MKCPYCGKKTSDMPTHLKKSKKCSDKHCINLKEQFINCVRVTAARQAEKCNQGLL